MQIKLEYVSPHTILKFELVQNYVKTWAQKLLNYKRCKHLIFIDCMANSGVYQDRTGNTMLGTPILVANYFAEIMANYPDKKATLYFCDLCPDKITKLKKRIPRDLPNLNIIACCCDGNDFLRSFNLQNTNGSHYLVFYDPYQATIDWSALNRFLPIWGEVIINHMVSDSIRAIPQVTKNKTRSKYENTYLIPFDEIVKFKGSKLDYENRIIEIMKRLQKAPGKPYYVASFPFFNSKNALVYHLIHGSSNLIGFNLFKKIAWQTFDGKSSSKTPNKAVDQLKLDFENTGLPLAFIDEDCYSVWDIASHIYATFNGQSDVPLHKIWQSLNKHPIFPEKGFRLQIKKILKNDFGVTEKLKKMSFNS